MEREEEKKDTVQEALNGGAVLRRTTRTIEVDRMTKRGLTVMIKPRKIWNIRQGETDHATRTGNAKDVD